MDKMDSSWNETGTDPFTFSYCGFTNVTIGSGVTTIGSFAFSSCGSLTKVYCLGNAPGSISTTIFFGDKSALVYYLPSTMGWSATYIGQTTALWKPEIQLDDGSFGAQTNQFGFNINWANGMNVVVEACTDLVNPIWQPVQANTITNASFYFSDPQWTNYPGRYYRLRTP